MKNRIIDFIEELKEQERDLKERIAEINEKEGNAIEYQLAILKTDYFTTKYNRQKLELIIKEEDK